MTASALPSLLAGGMETVVMVAIGVLAAVFVGSLIVLVILCWQKLSRNGVCGIKRSKCGGCDTRCIISLSVMRVLCVL